MDEEQLEHIGVAVVIVDPQTQKILLGERMNAYKAGFIGLPGGRIEIKENTKDAAAREIEEETGLIAESLDYIGVVRELQGSYNFVHFGMTTSQFSGTLDNREPQKCKGWEWYSIEDLPEHILPGHKALIDMFLNITKERMLDLGHE